MHKIDDEALEKAFSTMQTIADRSLTETLKSGIATYIEESGLLEGDLVNPSPVDPTPTPIPSPTPIPKLPADGKFIVFDQLVYRNKPPAYTNLVHPMGIDYEREFKLYEGEFGPARPAATEATAHAQKPGTRNVIDIEKWWTGDEALDDRAVTNYSNVLTWYRAAMDPTCKVGLYSTIPIRNYWDSIRNTESAWRRANDKAKAFAHLVDYTLPSLYTFYDNTPNDRDRWKEYCDDNVEEAKRIAPYVPCYVYMWPEMHPGNGPIDPDFWRMQLDYIANHKLIDGAVLWSVSSKTRKLVWQRQPAWKDVTMKWLNDLNDQRKLLVG